MNWWHLVAADWAGVVEREPGQDAFGVVDVVARHLARGCGTGESAETGDGEHGRRERGDDASAGELVATDTSGGQRLRR